MAVEVFNDLDVVRCVRRLSHEIGKGSLGTVVMVLKPREWYLVEYFDDAHNTIGVLETMAVDLAHDRVAGGPSS